MSELYLARHGNTFGGNDTPVWVGRNEDLPLVDGGEKQAQALANAFRERKIIPSAVLSSPLKRAVGTAEAFGLPITIREELNEIDYGEWGGKTTEQLESIGCREAVEQWNTLGIIPRGVGWGSSEDEIERQVRSFLSLPILFSSDGPVIAITSNGFLKCLARYALAAYDQLCAEKKLKVKTGHICKIRHHDGAWTDELWNISPQEFQDKTD